MHSLLSLMHKQGKKIRKVNLYNMFFSFLVGDKCDIKERIHPYGLLNGYQGSMATACTYMWVKV